MKKAAITVTEAARNFADCVNRAHYQDTSFVLLKNGKHVARLVPESERVCTGRDLAEAMDKAEISAEEARAWQKDLAVARRRLTDPRDTGQA
jgi:antitoxin (DNA-binding transcriptional repressor) of toxin-antitoxin stability system